MKFLPSFIRIRLEGRVALQKILTNTGWLFIDKIIRMIVGLLAGIWVARYLGPEQFGLYNYALSFVALFSTFATLGLDGIVVRNIVRGPSCKEEILGTAFVLKLLGGVSTLIFAVVAVSLLRPHENLTRWLVGITAAGMIFQAFDVIDFWFQSQVQSKYTVYAKNVAFLLITLVKIVLILVKAPLIVFAWAGLAEIVIGSVGLVIVYRINGFYVKTWIATISRSKMLVNDSWPLILSGIAIYIQARIDQVMLGEMVGDTEVGQYSAAMRLIEVFGFIPMIIYSSVLPKVSSAKVENESLYYERLLNIYRLMFLLFLVTAIPIYVFSNQIVIT
ncbi:MAG: flippase, partial [Ignavibacteriaceae bacterium]|nr:flippase [Ignavibacteriaceae bacterium]